MMSRRWTWALGLLAGLTAGCYPSPTTAPVVIAKAPNAPTFGPPVGRLAPEIAGHDVEGKLFKLSDYRGRVVVVDFWSAGCVPCRAVAAELRFLKERHSGEPFTVLGVNQGDPREVVQRFIDRGELTWRTWGGQGAVEAFDRWGITHIPAIFVLDGAGIVRHKHVHDTELIEAVAELLREAKTAKGG